MKTEKREELLEKLEKIPKEGPFFAIKVLSEAVGELLCDSVWIDTPDTMDRTPATAIDHSDWSPVEDPDG